MKKITLLTLSILTLNFSFSQVIGGSGNSELIPQEAKAASLSGGEVLGNVNVFNGNYSVSKNLGSVSTPGGMSYNLSLNYSASYSTGTSPSVSSGIPYGEGWNVNVPTIRVSSDAYFNYTKAELCSLHHDSVARYDSLRGQLEGDIYWFSPVISIPGVASGRAIFKYYDVVQRRAVFELNKFEKNLEIYYNGDNWEVVVENGDSYIFRVSLTTVHAPNNQRVIDYSETPNLGGNELNDMIFDDLQDDEKQERIHNVIKPKKGVSVWYCSQISNKNIPSQGITFKYKKFGAFNYFKEFLQPDLAQAIKNYSGPIDPNGGPLDPDGPGTSIMDYETYRDVLLEEVTSYIPEGINEIIELEYRTQTSMLTGNFIDFRDDTLKMGRLDSLYSFEELYSQSEEEQNFANWNRYNHIKSNRSRYRTGAQLGFDNPYNPYLNSNGFYHREHNISSQNNLSFSDGFLESERLLKINDYYPGDIYEIKTRIIDRIENSSNEHKVGNGTIDIKVVTGPNDVVVGGQFINDFETLDTQPDSNFYSQEAYLKTRGETVFSTSNQAIKWHMPSDVNHVETSNFFSLSNLPNSQFQGINIQIGPGNSDQRYNMDPTLTIDGIRTGSLKSSYYAYDHMVTGLGFPGKLRPHDRINSNFGVGMPWSMVYPIYRSMMGNSDTTSGRINDEASKFWWETIPENFISYENNTPTKLNEHVRLLGVKLIRYTKNPYMLSSVKKYVINGRIIPNIVDEGKILASQMDLIYKKKDQDLIENLKYEVNDLLQLSQKKQHVIVLSEIKNTPVNPTKNSAIDLDSIVPNEVLTTYLDYEIHGGFEAGVTTYQDTILARGGYVLNKLTNHLGGVTKIEYFGRDDTETKVQFTYSNDIVNCGVAFDQAYGRVYSIDVHPTVKSITQLDEKSTLDQTTTPIPLKITEYKYSATKVSTNYGVKLFDNFRGSYVDSDYNLGFKHTTVKNPILESGEQTYTKYTHKGNVTESSPTESIEDYLFFGKLEKIEEFNSLNQLESEKIIEYDYTLAYENGHDRPNYLREHFGIDHISRSYEYQDYYEEDEMAIWTLQKELDANGVHIIDTIYFENTDSIIGFDPQYENVLKTGNEAKKLGIPNLLKGQVGNYKWLEEDKFLNLHYYEELRAINPAHRLNSYFCKVLKEKERIYDNTCFKSSKIYTPVLTLEIADNPFGLPYTNDDEKPGDSVLINLVDAAPDSKSKQDLLTQNSPLSDNVLKYFIEKSITKERIVGERVIKNNMFIGLSTQSMKNVLIAQGHLSDEVLTYLFDHKLQFMDNQIVKILNTQPYVSDNLQHFVITEGKVDASDKIIKTVFLKNDYLSSSVLKHLISASDGITDRILKLVLLKQPQLPEPYLKILASGDLVKNAHLKQILIKQPVLTDLVYHNLIDNKTVSYNAITKIMVNAESYPSDVTLLYLLNNQDLIKDSGKKLNDKQLLNIFLASPWTISGIVLERLVALDKGPLLPLIYQGQKDRNPLDKFCGNEVDETRRYIENVTEYDYYEAEADGSTHKDGYKVLLAQEDVLGKQVEYNGYTETLDHLRLKHEPSWQVYSVKKSSPHIVGAYSKDEYFYYYDLLNRYDRHWKYYDLENGIVPDVSELGDTLVIVPQWHEDAQPTSSTGRLPQFDGMYGSRNNNLKSLAFQKTTTSKNHRSSNPVEYSSYYMYDMKFLPADLNVSTVVEHFAADCIEYPVIEPDTNCVFDCSDCIDFKTYYSSHLDEFINNLPFGYCVYQNNTSFDNFIACPEGTDISQYSSTHTLVDCNPRLDSLPPIDLGKTRPYSYDYQEALYLRDVVVQVDTLKTKDTNPSPSSKHFSSDRLDKNNRYVMDFYADLTFGDDNVEKHLALYPYDTLRTRKIINRNRYMQVALEHNQVGLHTKYEYDESNRVSYVNDNCVGQNHSGYNLVNVGMPNKVIVGAGLPDSLTTTYEYFLNKQVKSVTNPNQHKMDYTFDEYGRLIKSTENDTRVLSEVAYNYWGQDESISFDAKTSENYVKSLIYNDPTQLSTEEIRSYIDPLGREYSTISSINTIDGIQQIHSGSFTFDNWSRKIAVHKPYELTSASVLKSSNFSNARSQVSYENSQKSRSLIGAKNGIDLTDIHTVKSAYKLLNAVTLNCELKLSLSELALIMGSGSTVNQRFFRQEVKDEDQKLKIEYTNALGQKIATKMFAEENEVEPIVTLFAYDDYGNLSVVVNPEKQRSYYNYNLLGQKYQEITPDGGDVGYMYNKQGLVSYRQDEKGKSGEEFIEGAETIMKPFCRSYSYDLYGRLRTQKKTYLQSGLIFNFNFTSTIDASVVKPFIFKDTLVSTDDYSIPNNEGNLIYFNYKLSNASSLDWLNSYQTIKFTNTVVTESQSISLGGGTRNEKTMFYGQNNLDNQLGKLSHSVSYNYDGVAIQNCTYKYDNQERLLEELISFSPNGDFTDDTVTINSKVTYPSYNYRGSLLTKNVDANNDGILDFQYHYTYDDWNRLREVYGNLEDVEASGNLLATYDYNDALGLLTQSDYYAKDCNGVTRPVNKRGYTYDVRDRLNKASGDLYNYRLYYDDSVRTNIEMSKNWNGNINGTTYLYDFREVYNYTGTTTFDQQAVYGYTYDHLNRLVNADAEIGAFMNLNNSLNQLIGDANYYFDKIGNLELLKRTVLEGNDINTHSLKYNYLGGNNRLENVQGLNASTPDRVYGYDANGNLTTDSFKGMTSTTYTRATYPYHIDKDDADISYLYSANDLRIYKKVDQLDNGTITGTTQEYYLQAGGQDLGVYNYNDSTWQYFVFGKDRIAKVVPQADQQPGSNGVNVALNAEQLSFYIYDHLGNTRVNFTPEFVDNGNGGCSRKTALNFAGDYYPYGKILRQFVSSGMEEERYLTTGHERDKETDLDYRGARFYDSDVARFLSLDPLAVKRLSMTPYNYVLGNPVMRVDPDGKLDAPIYDPDGNYLGADADGIEGKGIIMDESDYKEGMSHKEALSKSLGGEALTSEQAAINVEMHMFGLNGGTQKEWDNRNKKTKNRPMALKGNWGWAIGGGFGLSIAAVRDSDGNWGVFTEKTAYLGVHGELSVEVEVISPNDGSFHLDDYEGESTSENVNLVGCVGVTVGGNLKKKPDAFDKMAPVVPAGKGKNGYKTFSYAAGLGGGYAHGNTETKKW